MSAYLISEAEVINGDLLGDYLKIAKESVDKFGGRYLTFAGNSQLVEGVPEPKGIVIIEFPDMETANRWYNSPDYAEGLEISAKAMRRRIVFVEGAPS